MFKCWKQKHIEVAVSDTKLNVAIENSDWYL